jgi:quercetin dioxygenase-like cupin family protein
MGDNIFARPPSSFRPDRLESITTTGERPPVELASGVHVDFLVSQHNGARNLATGLVQLASKAQLPYHTHPVSESVTVLSGAAQVSVEGREYELAPLDNIVIPRGLVHGARNHSSSEPARLHVAFASEAPGREWISTTFETRVMPETSTGIAGREHVTRFKAAPRSQAGPGTSFVDYFNRDLVQGIEMSGGYGLFQPGGRLPAHFHDFDESICIIQGTATCICEGRRHQMSDGATALQPRGRVHYFINESDRPMAMVWVYAGPLPERIVTHESYATGNRDAWGFDKSTPFIQQI